MRTVIMSIGGIRVAKRPLETGFKMDFEIKGTADRQVDWSVARIWNLKRDTEDLIKSGDYIQISAGFRDNVGVVGDGYVDRTSRERRDTDRVFMMRFSYVNPNAQPLPAVVRRSAGDRTDVPAYEVFQSYANEYERPVEGLELIPREIVFPGRFLPDKQTPAQGMTQALDRVRVRTEGVVDLDFVVQPTRILIVNRNPAFARKSIRISATHGLIGSPRTVDLGDGVEGVEVDAILDPRINLDAQINLESIYVRSGLYSIQSYMHQGDSYDGKFITRIIGVWAGDA